MPTLLKISLISLSIFIGLLSVGHLLLEYNALRQELQAFADYGWVFGVFRYVIYGFVVVLWPRWVEKLGKKRQWSEDTIAIFSKQRLKLIGLIIVIEVFFIHNLLGYLITSF